MVKDPQMQTVRRLLLKYGLSRIDLALGRSAHARAFPDSFNPVVEARRRAGFAAEGADSISMQRAAEITNAAARVPLCAGSGDTIDEALASLELALKATQK